MPIDPSIYGQIQQPEDQISKYAKLAQIQNLQGQGRLQDLQATGLQTKLDEEQAVKSALSKLQPGQDISSVLPDVLRASPSQGIALQKSALENKNISSQINERKIPALAGSFAMVLKAQSPTDDVVNQAGNAYTAATGEPHDQITNHILSLPLEQRKQFILSTAATNPTGQAALKLIYPDVETKDLLGTTTVKTPLSGVTKSPAGGGFDNNKTLDVIKSGGQAMADYSGPVPSAFALKSPLVQAQMAYAKEVNPAYDVGEHKAYQNMLTKFVSGRQGDQLRFIQVAHDHLNTWEQAATALQNGDLQLFNKLSNSLAAATGSAAPTNLEGIAKIVGPEIAKAIIPNGGGVGEREEFVHAMGKNLSPGQQTGLANSYRDLMAAQAKGLKTQFISGGGKEEQFNKKLSPELLKRMTNENQTSTGGTPASSQQIDDLIKKYGSR